MRRVVLWDFDGTLAHREAFRPHLRAGFPWHAPDVAHEKPHREAFALGRHAAGNPSELWMVGDNPVADVAGAKAAGIPSILVRRDGAPGLDAVVSRLGAPAR